jgi:hypothetical protein
VVVPCYLLAGHGGRGVQRRCNVCGFLSLPWPAVVARKRTLVTLVFKSSSYNSYIKNHFSLEYTIEGSIIFIKDVVKWLDNGFQLSTLLYRLASTLYSHNEEGLTRPEPQSRVLTNAGHLL